VIFRERFLSLQHLRKPCINNLRKISAKDLTVFNSSNWSLLNGDSLLLVFLPKSRDWLKELNRVSFSFKSSDWVILFHFPSSETVKKQLFCGMKWLVTTRTAIRMVPTNTDVYLQGLWLWGSSHTALKYKECMAISFLI